MPRTSLQYFTTLFVFQQPNIRKLPNCPNCKCRLNVLRIAGYFPIYLTASYLQSATAITYADAFDDQMEELSAEMEVISADEQILEAAEDSGYSGAILPEGASASEFEESVGSPDSLEPPTEPTATGRSV